MIEHSHVFLPRWRLCGFAVLLFALALSQGRGDEGSAPPAFTWVQLRSIIGAQRVFPSSVESNTVFLWTSSGLLVSHDAGATFASAGSAVKQQLGAVTALLVSPVDANLLYIGTAEKGVFVSRDAGKTFQPLGGADAGLTHLSIHSMAFAPNDASFSTLYVTHGMDQPGLSMTADGGKSWRTFGTDYGAAALAVTEDGIFFAGKNSAQGIGFYRYATTSDWFCVLLDKPTVMMPSPNTPHRIWFGTEVGLRVTDDAGQTMRQPNPGPAGAVIASLAAGFDPGHGEILFAYDPAAEGVLCSRDNGQNFEKLNEGFKPTEWTRQGANLAAAADGSVLYACRNGQFFRGMQPAGPTGLASVRVSPGAVVPGEDVISFTCRAAPGAAITIDCDQLIPGLKLTMSELPASDAASKLHTYAVSLPPLSSVIPETHGKPRTAGPVVLPVHATLGQQTETRYAVVNVMPILSDLPLWVGHGKDTATYANIDGVKLAPVDAHPRTGTRNLRLFCTGPGAASFTLGDKTAIDAWNHKVLSFYVRSDTPGPPNLKICLRHFFPGHMAEESMQSSNEVELSHYLPMVTGEYQCVVIPLPDLVFGSPCSASGIRQVFMRNTGAEPRTYDLADFSLIVKPAPNIEHPTASITSDGKNVRFTATVTTHFGSVRNAGVRLADGHEIPLASSGPQDANYSAMVPMSQISAGTQRVMFWAGHDQGVAREFAELFIPSIAPAVAPHSMASIDNVKALEALSFADAVPIHLVSKSNPAITLDARFMHSAEHFYCLFEVSDPAIKFEPAAPRHVLDDLVKRPGVEMLIRSPIADNPLRPIPGRDHRIMVVPTRTYAMCVCDKTPANCTGVKTEHGYALRVEIPYNHLAVNSNLCDFITGSTTRLDLILHAADGSMLVWSAHDEAATANPDTRGVLVFDDAPGPSRFAAGGAFGQTLLLTCTKRLDRAAASNIASYRSAGVTISRAVLEEDGQTILLTADSPWKTDGVSEIEFPGVRTMAGAAIEPLQCTIVPTTAADDGFVRECLICKPLANINPLKTRGVLFDENGHPDAADGWQVVNTQKAFDLAALTGQKGNAAVAMHLYIHSDAERFVQVRYTSSATTVRLILDDLPFRGKPAAGKGAGDELISSKMRLREGWHDLTITSINGTGPWDFSLRLRDSDGGPPVGISYCARRPWNP